MSKKYEFTGDEKVVGGVTLKRIRAIRGFGDVKKGDIGGWLECESNLSHVGDSWVYGKVHVCGEAWVGGEARISVTRDILTFKCVGCRDDTLTAFRAKKGYLIKVGCFLGSLEEFLKKVEETHDNNKFAKEYKLIAEVIKQRFEEEEE